MLGFGHASAACPLVTAAAPGDRDQRIYNDYAAGLYRQALLTLDSPGMAEQVVCDVLVDECIRPPPSAARADDTRRRLALAACRRCRELDVQEQRDHPAGRRPSENLAGCISSCRLSWAERGALGLVLFGGVGYAEASHELAISAADLAALLGAVLRRLAAAGISLAGQAPGAP